MRGGGIWKIYDRPTAPPIPCAYPRCAERCPRSMGFCGKHWFVLPQAHRTAIWDAWSVEADTGGPVRPELVTSYRAARDWARAKETPAQEALEL